MSDNENIMTVGEDGALTENEARERIYINGDEAHFVRTDITTVSMELCEAYGGKTYAGLEPRRLFPRTGLRRYITLLDPDGIEVAVIRNLDTLADDDRATIEECLNEYYHIPKVTKITGRVEKFGVIRFFTETDRGDCTIEVRNIVHQIKLTYGIRVMFLDNDDNRYEIPDIRMLDRKSRALLEDYL